ncbi:MAG: branched-chain amino acid ABC transporter ATP-binding protein [Pseudomonas sp.]|jgi:branched-chain amino acid transport system ATP-binding protein|uniref:Amino acid/amide ABC transporter ATP-binding protein 2 (HAAT family) n=1 Tax=Stutzerimonas stutzeri TaxID=316 RepID=A0A5S5B9G4_STUST|nr:MULTISPECIES: ABC transporter ATP-binding protein [Pseudomonadaceae]MAX92883.1 branched-chain amino acid ABC transporter ATP-binding protein [Pseudomonas sp.]MBU0812596.1 ABC transporter ATP-binding protein [Gammaproteobacteria bacterium]MBK3849024.1 ATP-binding cassette domain-containing protein [Stutzerimonas xanthomarina]MBK61198.1 branched-chain amino acid ABC transporter ATP-binding protein [Pseudomonas sp.]MBU0853625.1 ABC transporter ATP-binding protein [Gammaproteobacteria bacterium|tara:strand:+ start:11932 stop:12639 length:708 start_codon:yes stop_codon:yes gene_type:complete
MLQLDRVDVCYGSFKALTEVSMTVGVGELVVLLGANGAGKTTLFNTISGLLKPTAGSITLEGKRIDGLKPSALVAAGVVHCPEGRKLFPQMSVAQNLALGAYLHRRDSAGNKRNLQEVLDLFPILHDKRNQPAGSLSGGQQQMVAIGRALMSRPRLLMLDEPSLGLAPLVVNQMFEVISRINKSGTSVLLAEQNAFAALKIAHRAYVIEGGSLVMEGDQQAMLGNEAVRKAYIGA